MARTSWNDVAGFELGLPPANVSAAFTAAIHPLLERINASIFESRILAELRDTLLPKLLSGELRVRDAEKAVADAV